MSRFVPFFAFAALLVLSGCSDATEAVRAAPQQKEHKTAAREAPDFSLKDADGRTVKLSDYRGKVVLLNFWATWCGPCKLEMPWFKDFEAKYRDRGFAVIGISMDDDGWESVRPFLTENKINYRIVLGNDDVGGQYGGVESLPTTFVINRAGTIVGHHIGLVPRSEYEKEIVKALDENRTASAGRLSASRRPVQP